MTGAHNSLLDLEELDDKQLDRIRANYERLAQAARTRLKNGKIDTNTQDLKSKRRAAAKRK